MKHLIDDVAQLNQVLHAVANGITVQNTEGRLVFVNEAAARMMNCDSPDDAISKGGVEIIKGFKFYNEQGAPVQPAELPGRQALKGIEEPAMLVGYTSPKHDGMRWTSILALPVKDSEGNVTLAVNVLQDVTEIKNAEKRLKEANDRITKLLEQTLSVASPSN